MLPALIIVPSGIEISASDNGLYKEMTYNCTKWNWNNIGRSKKKWHSRLIIVPSGIEIGLAPGCRSR